MADAGNRNNPSDSSSQSSDLSINGRQGRPSPKHANACVVCIRENLQCDGVRPVCQSCAQRGIGCSYEAEIEDSAEVQEMEHILERANTDVDSLVFLLRAFRESTELEARMLLSQLRACDDVQAFAETMRRRGATNGAEVRR